MSEFRTTPFDDKYFHWREIEWRTNGWLNGEGEPKLNFKPDTTVKSCEKIESGLRLGHDAIRACCMGAIVSPMYWSAEEVGEIQISKEMIVNKRKWLFQHLNDLESGYVSCKRCHHVVSKKYKDVNFTGFGHINLAHFTTCNLRCQFCGFTRNNSFYAAKYDALPILEEFNPEDSEWDSFVDLNGGEPTLLKDLDKYIDFFEKQGTRVLLYTNSVKYHQSIYDGLLNGRITWVITSLDAGTPSSFQKIKGRDRFEIIVENLTRYAKAGAIGYGNLAVKYIFSDGNCSDDDIFGFTFAMLAIRPQKVWLTFDFLPLADIYEGQEKPREYDYSEHIKAYTKMFLLLQQYGMEPAHFAKTHLAQVLQAGKNLVQSVLEEIKLRSSDYIQNDPDLVLENFRYSTTKSPTDYQYFKIQPLRVINKNGSESDIDFIGKAILLAPACSFTTDLLSDDDIKKGRIMGVLDRNPVLHKKKVKGINILPYESVKTLNPDIIIVSAPEQHEEDIVRTISSIKSEMQKVFIRATYH